MRFDDIQAILSKLDSLNCTYNLTISENNDIIKISKEQQIKKIKLGFDTEDNCGS